MGFSFLALAAAFTLCGDGPRTNCVVDGDTFWINGVKVRLANINAPETQQAACKEERDLGNRAKDRLVRLLNSGPFDLEAEGRDTDRYGRALRVAQAERTIHWPATGQGRAGRALARSPFGLVHRASRSLTLSLAPPRRSVFLIVRLSTHRRGQCC